MLKILASQNLKKQSENMLKNVFGCYKNHQNQQYSNENNPKHQTNFRTIN